MSRRNLAILVACTIAAVLLVAWLGSEHGHTARVFLHNLMRTFLRAL